MINGKLWKQQKNLKNGENKCVDEKISSSETSNESRHPIVTIKKLSRTP